MNKNSESIYNIILKQYIELIPKKQLLKRQGIEEFLNILRKRGFKSNTLRLYYYSLKTTFALNKIKVDFCDPPVLDEDEVLRHIYSKDQVITLIREARRLGGIYSKAMAISTTYGIRRTELSNLKEDCFNFNENTVKIKAAKHGRTVIHLIPDEILPYIQNDIKMKSIATMSRVFNKIAANVNLKSYKSGWHSIRRSLVSCLIRESEQEKVIRFMRWKTKTMLDIYHIKDPREDLYIFERHPFLGCWT